MSKIFIRIVTYILLFCLVADFASAGLPAVPALHRLDSGNAEACHFLIEAVVNPSYITRSRMWSRRRSADLKELAASVARQVIERISPALRPIPHQLQAPLVRSAWLRLGPHLPVWIRHSPRAEALFTAIVEFALLATPPALVAMLSSPNASLDDPVVVILVAIVSGLTWLGYVRFHRWESWREPPIGRPRNPLSWRQIAQSLFLASAYAAGVLSALYQSPALAGAILSGAILLHTGLDEPTLRRRRDTLDRLRWEYTRLELPVPRRLDPAGRIEIVIPEETGARMALRINAELFPQASDAHTVVTDFSNELKSVRGELVDAGFDFRGIEALEIGPGRNIDELAAILMTFPELGTLHVVMDSSLTSQVLQQLPDFLMVHPEITARIKIYVGTVTLLSDSLKGRIRFVHLKQVLSQFSPQARRQSYLEIGRTVAEGGALYARGIDQPGPDRVLNDDENPFERLHSQKGLPSPSIYIKRNMPPPSDQNASKTSSPYQRRSVLFSQGSSA